MATEAEKVAKYREMAKDKSLPQDVRNTYLDKANEIEQKAAEKAGVKFAKGGAVAKKAPMSAAAKQPMKKSVHKELTKVMEKAYPKGATITPKLAKGGMAKKGKC